jgi:ankyrin repeat protein
MSNDKVQTPSIAKLMRNFDSPIFESDYRNKFIQTEIEELKRNSHMNVKAYIETLEKAISEGTLKKDQIKLEKKKHQIKIKNLTAEIESYDIEKIRDEIKRKEEICFYLSLTKAEKNINIIETKNKIAYKNLIHAVELDNVSLIEKALSSGIFIDFPDDEGTTALHCSAQLGKLNAFNFLIKRGANINSRNKYGFTAFHLAVFGSHIVILESLLSCEFLFLAESNDGITPKDLASGDIKKIIEAKNNFKEDVKPKDIFKKLIYAIETFNLSEVRHALEMGIHIDMQDNEGCTALHRIAHVVNLKNINIMSLLINKGANVNAKNNDGFTPLHLAVFGGCIEAIRLLLDAGADSSIKDNSDNSSMDYANDELKNLISSESISASSNLFSPSI